MADDVKGNTAVDTGAPGDRVASLSLNADGSVAQLNPELIGDKESIAAHTRDQFTVQAVSAADARVRREQELAGASGAEPSETEDPRVADLRKAHDSAAAGAVKAADAAVKALS